MVGTIPMIELLDAMCAAYDASQKLPPGYSRSGVRKQHILHLNSFHELTAEQIASCTGVTRAAVHGTIRSSLQPKAKGTRGRINPQALTLMSMVAKQLHNGEMIDATVYARVAVECGDPAIVSKLTGIPLYILKLARHVQRNDSV